MEIQTSRVLFRASFTVQFKLILKIPRSGFLRIFLIPIKGALLICLIRGFPNNNPALAAGIMSDTFCFILKREAFDILILATHRALFFTHASK